MESRIWNRFLSWDLFWSSGKYNMKLSEEQEKQFREMIKKTENETILKCVKCGVRLLGMKQVRIHVDKCKHYEYEKPGSKMRLLIG